MKRSELRKMIQEELIKEVKPPWKSEPQKYYKAPPGFLKKLKSTWKGGKKSLYQQGPGWVMINDYKYRDDDSTDRHPIVGEYDRGYVRIDKDRAKELGIPSKYEVSEQEWKKNT